MLQDPSLIVPSNKLAFSPERDSSTHHVDLHTLLRVFLELIVCSLDCLMPLWLFLQSQYCDEDWKLSRFILMWEFQHLYIGQHSIGLELCTWTHFGSSVEWSFHQATGSNFCWYILCSSQACRQLCLETINQWLRIQKWKHSQAVNVCNYWPKLRTFLHEFTCFLRPYVRLERTLLWG